VGVENRMLRRLRNVHSRELHNVYSAPNIIRAIKPKRMRGENHVARIRLAEMRNAYKTWSETVKGERPLGRVQA
jgi:hypothetical protein